MVSLRKINLCLDFINYFNKKIKVLKKGDHPANNAHIYALETFIETIEKSLREKRD